MTRKKPPVSAKNTLQIPGGGSAIFGTLFIKPRGQIRSWHYGTHDRDNRPSHNAHILARNRSLRDRIIIKTIYAERTRGFTFGKYWPLAHTLGKSKITHNHSSAHRSEIIVRWDSALLLGAVVKLKIRDVQRMDQFLDPDRAFKPAIGIFTV